MKKKKSSHAKGASTSNKKKKEKHNEVERKRSRLRSNLIQELFDFIPEQYRCKDKRIAKDGNKILESCIEYLRTERNKQNECEPKQSDDPKECDECNDDEQDIEASATLGLASFFENSKKSN